MTSRFHRALAGVLMLTTSLTSVTASAASISPEAVLAETTRSALDSQRAELAQWLQRDDIRSQMQALGVDPRLAEERVAALSDAEVQDLHGRLDEARVAGNGVVGALVFIFVLLLVTDLLGLTKVFPFTRSVR
ncbi:PA2779 family protein [Perlucidibaca piscinae]|uniref:PA2779 family protein n=1 Tax=Perlucidibaca piscinae TaxID=392589 RepID=UPI0003B70CBC|nr:PA2779 family protein [Perlucidibaca piscinae]